METLQAADTSGKSSALAFVGGLNPSGGTNVFDPLANALRDPEVDAIYLLSDGEPNEGLYYEENAILTAVAELNAERNVTINTISVGRISELMRRLAEHSGGHYMER